MESEFNVLAVISAAVAAMLLGGVWYSPILFERKWRELSAISDSTDCRNPVFVYGLAFLLLLVSAAVFHAFLGSDPDFAFAAGVGLAAGIAWAAGSLWISYLFEGRNAGLYAINGGYHILQFTIYGVVFGAW